MLNALEGLISKKSIVLLGESAHGVHEYNSVRADFIRALHENHGFQVLIMESAVGPLLDTTGLSAIELVKRFFHAAYHTEEVVALAQYALSRGMVFAGIEISGSDLERYRELKAQGDDFGARTYRDKTMYENFSKLVVGPLAGQKVIFWGHNVHIMKKNCAGSFRKKVLGEFIAENLGEKSLSIGQYAGGGSFEHMPGQIADFSRLPDDSLERYIRERVSNIQVLSSLKGSEIDRLMPTLNCGLEVDTINVAEHFDALILHLSATAPTRV